MGHPLSKMLKKKLKGASNRCRSLRRLKSEVNGTIFLQTRQTLPELETVFGYLGLSG